MKKTLLLLPLLLLSGCASTKEPNDGTTRIKLSKDNYLQYLNVVYPEYEIKNWYNFTISFAGVLNFAVYENVTVDLNMHIFNTEDGGYSYKNIDENFKRTILLNAGGQGSSTLYYQDGTIDGVVKTGIVGSSLMYYHCIWSIASINGTVHYKL